MIKIKIKKPYLWYCVCCYFLAVNFDWSTILIRKSFGASRHISGKLGVKLAIAIWAEMVIGLFGYGPKWPEIRLRNKCRCVRIKITGS